MVRLEGRLLVILGHPLVGGFGVDGHLRQEPHVRRLALAPAIMGDHHRRIEPAFLLVALIGAPQVRLHMDAQRVHLGELVLACLGMVA